MIKGRTPIALFAMTFLFVYASPIFSQNAKPKHAPSSVNSSA